MDEVEDATEVDALHALARTAPGPGQFVPTTLSVSSGYKVGAKKAGDVNIHMRNVAVRALGTESPDDPDPAPPPTVIDIPVGTVEVEVGEDVLLLDNLGALVDADTLQDALAPDGDVDILQATQSRPLASHLQNVVLLLGAPGALLGRLIPTHSTRAVIR